MLIDNGIGVLVIDNAPRVVIIIALEPSTRRRDNRYFGVFFFNCLIKRVEVSEINLADVFIPETYVFKIKRLFASVFDSFFTPYGRFVAVGVFD